MIGLHLTRRNLIGPERHLESINLKTNLSPLQRVSGHWEVHFESQNLILNPCGAVHDTVLGSDCEGAIACAKLSHMKKWATVSELSKPEVEEPARTRNGDGVGGFTLTYAKGSSDACPFDRKDVSAKLEITFKCGKTLGKPKPLEDGLISNYDCTSVELKYRTPSVGIFNYEYFKV